MIEKKDAPAAENAPEILNDNVQDLKAAREARGLTLRDVFLLTRVSLINLQAVETEDFHHLPPPVYARNCLFNHRIPNMTLILDSRDFISFKP